MRRRQARSRASRLPPRDDPAGHAPPPQRKKQKKAEKKGGGKCRLVHPRHVRLVLEPVGDDEDDDGEILLLYAHGNNRDTHMLGGKPSSFCYGGSDERSEGGGSGDEGGEDKECCVRFPYEEASVQFLVALVHGSASGSAWVPVPLEASGVLSQLETKGLVEVMHGE